MAQYEFIVGLFFSLSPCCGQLHSDITLCSTYYFQASLSEMEKIAEAAEQQLRSTLREILIVEAEMENLQCEAVSLRGRCASISVENTQLKVDIREQEAEAETVLEKFTAYRNKMQVHKAAVELVSCQTQEHKALEESRALVRRLTQQRDELREDLDNPKGNTVQREKVEKGEQYNLPGFRFKLVPFFYFSLLHREKLKLWNRRCQGEEE